MASSLPTVGVPAYPTPSEIRNSLLRTVQFAYAQVGLTANIPLGSDLYIRFDALSKRISVALANNQIARSDYSPLTAVGDALIDLLYVFGVPERPAEKATGYVTVKTTAACTIPADYQCTGPTGTKYVTTGITLGAITGTQVQVSATEAGLEGNLAATSTVTWDSAQVGQLSQIATVASGGIDGGADADDEEAKRRRLIDRIAFPAAGGNVNQVRTWAEDASAAVLVAFVYAAVRGPGSYDVALVGSSGDGVLTTATTAIIAARILAQMPGHASLSVTSVTSQLIDMVISLALPLPVAAGGSGGGWRDASPWPTEDTKVTAYSATTGIATVNSTATPTAGNQIGIWDPTYINDDLTTGKMVEYTILGVPAVGGGAGAWTFAVQGGFNVTPLGAYVSAGAVNLIGYADAIAAKIRALGPGEKTTSVDIMPRGRRQPGIEISYPNGLTNKLLDAVDGTFTEVEDIAYTLRVKTGTATAITSPEVPATTADPPNRLTLKYLAFRKA
jgi:uncharacterized phage protein gp47/JayE